MEYTYSTYENYLYSQNIAGCIKCGSYLLNRIFESFPGNKKLRRDITKVLKKLNKVPVVKPVTMDNLNLLYKVKIVIYVYGGY